MGNSSTYAGALGRQSLLLIVFAIICLLAPTAGYAISINDNHQRLDKEFSYLADPSGTLTLEEILANPDEYHFVPAKDGRPETNYEPVWLKLTLDFNENILDRQYYLFARVGNFFDLRVYRPNAQGDYYPRTTGLNYPASTREIDAERYGFYIQPRAEPTTLYIRYVGGPGTANLPWDLIEKTSYYSASRWHYGLGIACMSGIAALLCFNLIIALSLKRKNHLYYCLYVGCVMMGLMTAEGVGAYHLWPDLPQLNSRATHFFNLLSASFRLLAIFCFLDMADRAPRWNLATAIVFSLLGATFTANLIFGVAKMPAYIATYAWAIGILYGFAVCIHAIRLRVKLALPLFLSMLVPALSALIEGWLAVSGGAMSAIQFQAAEIGFVIHVILFSFCLAAQMKDQAESHMVALHDDLTGLPGKTLLEERFEWAERLSKRQQWKMALLYIDLDGFKAVNDSLGHTAGDKLLVQASARMQGALRETDFLARVGGDEFVILLIELKEDYAVVPAVEKLLESVAKPYRIDGKEARISASIGVSLYPSQGEDLTALVKAADAAMYTAKGNGKNAFAVADIRHRTNVSKPPEPTTPLSVHSQALVKYLT